MPQPAQQASTSAMAEAFRAVGIRASAEDAAIKAELLLEQAWQKHPQNGSDRIAYVMGGLLGEATYDLMVNSPFKKFLEQAIGHRLAQTLKDIKAAEAEKQAEAAKKAAPAKGKATASGAAHSADPVENGRANAVAETKAGSPDHFSATTPPAISSANPMMPPPAASKPKAPLKGIAAMVTDEGNTIAAKKSYLDIMIGGKPLYNLPIGRALELARAKENKALQQFEAPMQDIHVSVFVHKISSGVNDQSKPTSHYWPNKYNPELATLWQRAGLEAMAKMATRVAEYVTA